MLARAISSDEISTIHPVGVRFGHVAAIVVKGDRGVTDSLSSATPHSHVIAFSAQLALEDDDEQRRTIVDWG
jgi:hypothetical protein